MLENSYTNRFRKKSDSELKEIANNAEVYIDEARATAKAILNERMGITAPEAEESLNASLTSPIATSGIPQQALTTDDDSAEPEDSTLPELHSKTVITSFCILFSPFFGAVLLMYNMKQTKNINGWYQVLVFTILYSILTGMAYTHFNIPGFLGLTFNLAGALILTEWYWNRHIGKNTRFNKRSWTRPAIIAFSITCLLLVLTLSLL